MTDVAMAISTDAAYLDHLVTHNSWSRLVIIALIAISCYDVISTYIPFTFTAKETLRKLRNNAVTKYCQTVAGGRHCRQSGTCNMIHQSHQTPSCNPYSDAWRPCLHGRPGLIIAVTFALDSASLAHGTPCGIPPWAMIPRSLHNMTATTANAEKVAAVVQLQRQSVQHGFACSVCCDRCSLCRRLTYLATPAAIACVAAVPFLGLQLPGTATSHYSALEVIFIMRCTI